MSTCSDEVVRTSASGSLGAHENVAFGRCSVFEVDLHLLVGFHDVGDLLVVLHRDVRLQPLDDPVPSGSDNPLRLIAAHADLGLVRLVRVIIDDLGEILG